MGAYTLEQKDCFNTINIKYNRNKFYILLIVGGELK